MTEPRRGALDPRLYQIVVLGALLVYGWTWLEFDITPARAALLLATVLLAQWTCSRFWGVAATIIVRPGAIASTMGMPNDSQTDAKTKTSRPS